MDDLRSFWNVMARELAVRCCTDSAALDIKLVESRSKTEGEESFFCLTLPAFCREFEKALSQEAVTHDLFQGWRRLTSTQGQGLLPQFLGGFTSRVFDRNSGALLEEPDIDSIFAVRQLTLVYSKLLLPTTEARRKKAMDGYIECEQEVRRFDAERSPSLVEEFRQASSVLWGTVLHAVDEDVNYGRIVPRHGPGATADRLTGNRKFDQVEWTDRLERVFSWVDFIVPSARYFQEYHPIVRFLEPGDERPTRVVDVPKTLKTPRIIAIEPTCMQYVQQGLAAKFVEYIESPFVWYKQNHNVGFGVVGFTHQEPNQQLACEGSLSGELATLDLSEASDRVSNQLVRAMLDDFPNLSEGVDACRSRKADVPGHGVVRLAKFASMGSALTFPIEAMVFSTIVFMAIARAEADEAGDESRARVDTGLILRHRSGVRVYGDDIVVPVRFVHRVVEYLTAFGLKVNSNKSFWTGRFRESCGKEYYNGLDVSVVKVRRKFPSRPEHGMDDHGHQGSVPGNPRRGDRGASKVLRGVRPSRQGSQDGAGVAKPVQPGARPHIRGFVSGVLAQSVVSCVDLRNQCYLHGLWGSAGFLDGYLQGVLAHYPTVSPDSSALGRVSLLGYETQKMHSTLHSPLVKAFAVRPKLPLSRLSGPGALLKCLLGKSEDSPSEDTLAWLNPADVDPEHLNRAGRDQAVSIMPGWIRPF